MSNPSPHVWKRARSAIGLIMDAGLTPVVRIEPDGSVEVKGGVPLAECSKTVYDNQTQETDWKVDPDEIQRAEHALARRGKAKEKG